MDCRRIYLPIDNTYSRRRRPTSIKKEETGEVCCPLPLPLQDLCLLVVVNNLHTHQVDLLVSLPRWFRQRLLNVLPALDLGRLERTAIAADVDVESIWNCRGSEVLISRTVKTLSQLHVDLPVLVREQRAATQRTLGLPDSVFFQFHVSKTSSEQLPILMEEVKSALKNVKQMPEGKAALITIASEILKKYPDNIVMSEMIHTMISVGGDVVFSSLLVGSIHDPCQTTHCCRGVWKKQATALAVNVQSSDLEKNSSQAPRQHHRTLHSPIFVPHPRRQSESSTSNDKRVDLTPHRHLPILYRCDPLELLSLLIADCGLQPSSAYIHIDSICQTILSGLNSEQLHVALESNCSLEVPSDSYTSVLNHFLEKAVVFSLCCNSYSHISVMVGLINGVVANHENCQLKHLVCKMPNLYLDVIDTLSAVFALPSFCQLTLEVNDLNPTMVSKLLLEFMTAPCSHTQKLKIQTKMELLRSLPKLQENQVATLKGKTKEPLPPSSAQYKELELSSRKEYTRILQLLLQFSSVRLKEIVLDNLDEYPDYLHLCAIHPDLHITKLTVDLSGIKPGSFSASRQSDLTTLVQMTSLQGICIYGNWGTNEQVKLALVNGLRSRNQSFPLSQLALMLAECSIYTMYKMSDLQALCDAIFSLPQLENLELTLGKGFDYMFQQPKSYEQLLYRCWCQKASNVHLKSICVSGYISKPKYLTLVAKEYSNTTQLNDVRRHSKRERLSKYNRIRFL